MVINITGYHAKEFEFYLLTPWRQKRFLNKKMTRSNLPLKNKLDSNIRWTDRHDSGQFIRTCFNSLF